MASGVNRCTAMRMNESRPHDGEVPKPPRQHSNNKKTGLCMKRYGYYEYDPGLYPRRLWVAVGLRPEDLEGVFKSEKGKPVDFDLCVAEAVTCFEVRRCSDNKIGELVVFDNHATMRLVGIVSHEASHVCDAIEEAICMEHGGEASAYLIEWIASCINNARLGIGDFVELKDKKE